MKDGQNVQKAGPTGITSEHLAAWGISTTMLVQITDDGVTCVVVDEDFNSSLYTDTGLRIASHNGNSWCLNPAHSDVEFTTVSAALFLTQMAVSHVTEDLEEPHPLDEPVQKQRHRIHQAVELREIPYRLDERTLGLKLWRSDVLSWWEAQR